MSRHKNIRNLDLDEELYDYDGDDYDDGPGEISESDRNQLNEGLRKTREILGNDIAGLTDKDIQESLWYYFFDVEKTVNYILNQHGKSSKKKKPKAKKGSLTLSLSISSAPSLVPSSRYPLVLQAVHHPYTDCTGCSVLISGTGQGRGFLGNYEAPKRSAVEYGFFLDAPWGGIPEDRRGSITSELLCPRGGLLGGSGPPGGKTSKLAALAKARKEKAEAQKKQQSISDGGKSTAISMLSRLSVKQSPPPVTQTSSVVAAALNVFPEKIPGGPVSMELAPIPNPITNKSSQSLDRPTGEEPEEQPASNREVGYSVPAVDLRAGPSNFALSMFGDRLMSVNGIEVTDSRMFSLPGAPTSAFAGPSPDDVVVAAQSSSKGLNEKAKAKNDPKSLADSKAIQRVEAAVQAINIDNMPVKQRKKINVLNEYKTSTAKENANFVVIGHVDAGKSTLMGRLLLDTGVVDQRTIEKFKQEAEKIGKSSFALAWVLDQTEEERSRGVTMDIAVNKFETDKARFTILDAPGHRDFIPNMIAGASQADFAVLVIDSSTGAFESGFHLKGQTKEHTLLVRSMGVQRIIVAVNKLDSVEWSYERFKEIEQQMTQFLTQAGFASKNISFIPCSGLTGGNIVKKPKPGLTSWYSGPTLVEELEKTKPLTRAIEKPLRLTISDVFKGGIMNPVSISGRIEAGSLQVGDSIVAVPSGENGIIKAIEVDEEPMDWAVAGHNVVIHLSNIDMVHLREGDILCDPSNRVNPQSSFTIKILAFENLTPMMVDVHRGRLHAPGKIVYLFATLDKASGAVVKKKPRHIPAGSLATIKVELMGSPIPLEAGYKVVLRGGGQTVAAGIVE